MMCNCKNVDFGSYDNQEVLEVPDTVILRMNNPERTKRKTVCIDTCLVGEIKHLWSLGISTTSCCCGHNKIEPYIGVEDKYIQQMLDMGYVQNHPDKKRTDTFKARSVEWEQKQ